jgi:hypothetical protein
MIEYINKNYDLQPQSLMTFFGVRLQEFTSCVEWFIYKGNLPMRQFMSKKSKMGLEEQGGRTGSLNQPRKREHWAFYVLYSTFALRFAFCYRKANCCHKTK